MIEVRKLLKSRLKGIHPRVHFLRAPENADFPYLVYSFQIANLPDGLNLITLDVNGWDINPDTTGLETLMESVHSSFKDANIITEKLVVHFYSDRQFPVDDDDPTVKRRTNIYIGRLFER